MDTIVRIGQASPTNWRADGASPRQAPDKLPLSWGILYPWNDLIAVIDDYGEAERAARALLDAGIAGDAIDVLEGRYFVALHRSLRRRRGIFARMAAGVSRLFSDDAAAQQALVDEARQGHALLIVHAEAAGVAERVCDVLAGYHAHAVRLYRRGCIEDLGA